MRVHALALIALTLALAAPSLAAATAADLNGTWVVDGEATFAEWQKAGMIPKDMPQETLAQVKTMMIAQFSKSTLTNLDGASTSTSIGPDGKPTESKSTYTVDAIDGDKLTVTVTEAEGKKLTFTATVTGDTMVWAMPVPEGSGVPAKELTLIVKRQK